MKKAVLLILFVTINLLAFGGTGTIKGTIVDAVTGEKLFGCNVLVQGTTIGTVSDFDGNFVITNVPTGAANVVFSFVSFEKQIIRTDLENGETQILNIKLQPITTTMADVTVRATRKTGTEMAMMSSIKASAMIVSGISSQQISRSVDKDAAEVIRRVPGITIRDGRFVIVRGLAERYNSVLLNNAVAPSSEQDSRAFSFDLIPSNMIDNILINKTPAPELPADFAGAAINIITKNTVDKNSIELTLSSGYVQGATGSTINTQKASATDWLGADNGMRALPTGMPSTDALNTLFLDEDAAPDVIADRIAKRNAFSKSFDNSLWKVGQKTALPEFSGNLLLTRRFTIGSTTATNITSLNYKSKEDFDTQIKKQYQTPDSVKADPFYNFNDGYSVQTVNLGVIHNWMFMFGNNTKIEFRNFFNQIGTSEVIERNGVDYQQDTIKGYSLDYTSRRTYSGQLSSSFKPWMHTSVNALLGYSYANRNEPDVRRFQYRKDYRENSLAYGQYRIILSNQPTPEYGGRLYFKTVEHSVNGGFDVDQDLTPIYKGLKLKGGVFAEVKSRGFNTRRFGLYTTRNSKTHATDITEPMMFTTFSDLVTDANIYDNGGLLMRDKTDYSDSYDVNSTLSAGYMAVQMPVLRSKVNIYAGVRYENYRRSLSGFERNKGGNIDYNTSDLFPSINLSYNFTPKQLVRFAYGRTINRPEFREVAPFYYIDFEKYATTVGDTGLVSAYVNNFDVRYEWYPSSSETVSLALFYKKFKNPIENALLASSGNSWIYQPFNTPSAYSRGVEVEVRKSFASLEDNGSFLRVFKDLTVVCNGSIIQSEIKDNSASARDSVRPLQGQSPFILNVGLYYDNAKKGLMASVSYNVIGEKIIAVGTKSGDNDFKTPHTYELPRNVIDITISKRFGDHLIVKAGIKDLLQEPLKQVQRWDVPVASGTKSVQLETLKSISSRVISAGLTYKF